MSTRSLVPETYPAWCHCIEVDCGLDLTPAFIAARLQALVDDCDRINTVTTTNRAGWRFGSIKACSGLLEACAPAG